MSKEVEVISKAWKELREKQIEDAKVIDIHNNHYVMKTNDGMTLYVPIA